MATTTTTTTAPAPTEVPITDPSHPDYCPPESMPPATDPTPGDPSTQAVDNTPLTFSPDPQHLLAGAGTAAVQAARPREYRAGGAGIGYVTVQPVAATTAVAGTPGTWTPAGSYVPGTMPATGITASPATAWTTGQRVVARDGSEWSWTGTAWALGRRP